MASHEKAADFEPSGFFALRTPLLPWEELEAWGCGLRAADTAERTEEGRGNADEDELASALEADRTLLRQRLQRLLERPEIREALFVAAPALDNGIAAWLANPESKKGQRAEQSLVRYFLRMATRPTPFGLFSGCSIGGLGTETRLRLVDRADYQRHTRLDTDYLYAVTEDLGRDLEVRRRSSYRPNDSLYLAAGRLRYAESRLVGSQRVHHLVAVDMDDYLESVLAIARRGATFEDLAQALVTQDPDGEIEREEAEEYLEELIDAQILVSDLSPLVTGEEPIHDLLWQLADRPEAAAVRSGLERARARLAAFDEAGLGLDSEGYRAVARRLEELPTEVRLQRLFQVDMIKPAPGACLGPRLLEEIQRALGILQRLAEPMRDDPLSRFRDAFTERFGEHRMVPLSTALDEGVGVGFPGSESAEVSPLLAGFRLPEPGRGRTVPWGPRIEMLFAKLEQALASGAREISLGKKDLEALGGGESEPLPDGFQVMATAAAESAEALDRGDFELFLRNAYGPSGAQLLGRFCHADGELRRRVEQHLRREEAMQADAIFAEVVHLPEGRVGNILARPRLREHEIPFLGRSGATPDLQIPLSDLRVSVVGREIVLHSDRLGRRVIPRLTTAHNYSSKGLVTYRFLGSLQNQGVAPVLGWHWGPLESAAFLPRVRSGRLVLARARWKVSREEVAKIADKKGAERFVAVRKWRGRRSLPRLLLLQDGDNELLLDLDNALSIDTFLALVKNRPHCTLIQPFPSPDRLCVESSEGRFVHELIVPFLRRKAAHRTSPAPRARPEGKRTFVPGSRWLYAKLYTGTATADQLLSQVVRPMVEKALCSGAADSWFFLRYGDPDWHLRLRFHGEPARLQGEVLPWLERAVSPLVEAGWIRGLQLDTYDRELERYGGAHGMALAERLFRIDSEAVLDLLAELEGDEGAAARWRLALRGIVQLLADLGFDAAARLALLRRMQIGWAEEFQVDGSFRKQLARRLRQERADLEEVLQEGHADDHPLAPGFAILDRRSRRLAPIRGELESLEAARRLTLPREDLAISFVHMFTNRLLRSQGRLHELVLYDFLFQLLSSQAARRGRTHERTRRSESHSASGRISHTDRSQAP
ncbi:MAG: lantibiotic dehydratase [Holophagales bacterium]|nr:lantibiotic dehydratase [Holophagales bacterium]